MKESFVFEDGAEYIRNIDPDFFQMEEEQSDTDRIRSGIWKHPFPNEEGNSLAFGMVEAFAQEDIGPMLIEEHGNIISYAIF